jgi:hypothetical protein
MSVRPVPLHLGLLLVALLAAWLTFRGELAGEATSAEEGDVLVQAAEGDVERIVYESEGRTLFLESRRDEVGRWFAGRETIAAVRDEGAAGPTEEIGGGEESAPTGGDEGPEPPPPSTEVFPGGAAVGSLWQLLEPLRVRRVLGELDDEKLAELGLAEATASLTVVVRGREHRFELGGEVFGSGDRYARETDGRVVVLPGALVRDLEASPERLMEWRLIRATRPEVETVEIARQGKSMTIVQHAAAQIGEAFLTLAGQDEPSGEVETWADKLFRLEARGYRAGELPADRRPEATIVVDSREHGRETLDLWSIEEAGRRVWLGRSAHTRMLAELGALAEEVSADLDGLLR